MSSSSNTRPHIAVVGVSALFPGSVDSTGFWKNILNGADLVGEVPPSHWLIEDYYDPDPKAEDKTYARRGAFLPQVDFDALHWGVPPSIIEATDTTQLLALIVAQKVLEDAFGAQFTQMDRSRMSIIMGVTASQELMGHMVSRLQRPVWQKCLRESGIEESRVQEICQLIADQYVPWQESTFPGLLGNVVAGRIANRLDLGGTNCVTDAACASTFSAMAMAVNELYLGDSDVVLVGGADTMNDPFMFMCFSKTPAMSPTGDCRPLSDSADGTMLGEGIGMVALKRLEDAQRDGDSVYAVLRGLGTSSDGRSKSVYAPVSEGQANALRRAYQRAGYGPETVELMEAHGTGTKAGDAAEFAGLRTVFEESGRTDSSWCALGTVKSQIGHTKAAAGAAGLFKTVMALHHKVLPPTIKIERPNPALGIEDSPFHLNTRTRPWVRSPHHPRRASVSSFGFGGANYHITLEEVTGTTRRAPRLRSFSHEMVTLHADSPGAMVGLCLEMAGRAPEPGQLLHLAHQSQQQFRAGADVRLAIIAKDERDLQSKLKAAATQIQSEPDKDFSAPTGIHYGRGTSPGGIAFLFPGQGSQYIDMGTQLATSFSVVMQAWDDAAGLDLGDASALHQVVYPEPAFDADAEKAQVERLTRTEWAQPAIGCTSLSMLRLLRTLGLEPDTVGGHSFGEVTALHAAGVLSVQDFLRVARKRGEMMARAARTPGAMTAVSHPVEDVQKLLNQWRSPVVVANINSPNQVVLSGRSADIEAVEVQLKQFGLRFKRLPVATAFHSPVVAEASRPFGRYLSHVEFSAAQVPVFANTTARPHGADAQQVRDTLAAQISHPVRFVEMIENMSKEGIHTFVEVGPGSILTGLVSRILDGRPHAAIAMDRKGRAGILSLWNALGRLAALGIEMDLSALWDEYAVPMDPATRSQPRMAVPLSGSNYGRPYPPPGGSDAIPAPNDQDVKIQKHLDRLDRMPAPSLPSVAAQATPPNGAPSNGEFNGLPANLGGSNTVASPVSPLPESGVGQGPPADWLQSFEEAQKKTAEAHTAYQKSMAEAHSAYLRTAEAGFAALRSLLDDGDLPLSRPSAIPSPAAMPKTPVFTAPVSASPAPPTPLSETTSSATPVSVPVSPVATVRSVEPPPAAPVVVPPTPAPAPVVQASPAAAVDGGLHALLMEVVADKTGYPAEMLDVSMQLEGDLGIDSIKRVEILSAMQERHSSLPEVDPAAMAGLKTLGQIVEYLGQQSGTSVVPTPALTSAPVSTAPAPTPVRPVVSTLPVSPVVTPPEPVAASAPSPGVDLQPLLMEVVAEKTGYPSEMLDVGMQLEGDLGIDSIKRVEILSAMQERHPSLPEVDPAAMAGLKTLGQIVDYLAGQTGSATQEPSTFVATPMVQTPLPAPVVQNALPSPVVETTEVQAPTASSSAAGVDLQALLMEVVAEKTGYPADMLDVSMQLEGDLGIDSIKRVEILSAMQERHSNLPEVDPAAMAGLKTLGQIVDYLGGEHAPNGTSPSPVLPTVEPSPSPSASVLAHSVVPAQPVTSTPDSFRAAPAMVQSDSGLVSADTPMASPSIPDESNTAENTESLDPSDHGLVRTVLGTVPSARSGFASRGLYGPGTLVVVDDGGGVGGALIEELRRRGLKAHLVDSIDRLPRSTRGIIFLAGLKDIQTRDEAIAVNRQAFETARIFAQELPESGCFVTVQDTGGDFGLNGQGSQERAWLAGLAGLARTAAQEWPQISVRALDLERSDRSARDLGRVLCDELIMGGNTLNTGLRASGERLTLVDQPVPTRTGRPSLQAGDFVVVSGGAKGVTAATIIALSKTVRGRFLLLGRSATMDEPEWARDAQTDGELKSALMTALQQSGQRPHPREVGEQVARVLSSREILATLNAIRDAGAEARYAAVSVTDQKGLSKVIDSMRQEWGPVRGLIHGAGVIADKHIRDKSSDDFQRVFDTKVRGLEVLFEATASDPLKWIGLFSSVAARTGNQGQCDYAMANEVLNKVAQVEARKRPDCLVRSLGWGPWEGGMVQPQLKARFEAMGVPLIPISVGAKMLVDEVSCADRGQVELVLGGPPRERPLLDESGPNAITQFEIMVDQQSHPHLRGHAIEGTPVVPVVLVAEWFLRAAREVQAGSEPLALNHLKVLRGIRLDDWRGAGHRFILQCEVIEENTIALELHGIDGTLHYSAQAMGAGDGLNGLHPPLLSLAPWGNRPVYGDVLFHGPEFQGIRAIEGVGEAGISGQLVGLDSIQWSDEPWASDVLTLDGALQLALLWSAHQHGLASLPTRIEYLRWWSENATVQAVRAILTKRELAGNRTVSDVLLVDEMGTPIAELCGVETHALPRRSKAVSS